MVFRNGIIISRVIMISCPIRFGKNCFDSVLSMERDQLLKWLRAHPLSLFIICLSLFTIHCLSFVYHWFFNHGLSLFIIFNHQLPLLLIFIIGCHCLSLFIIVFHQLSLFISV